MGYVYVWKIIAMCPFPSCTEVSVQVYGVSVNTVIYEGKRTFNISWRVSYVPGLSHTSLNLLLSGAIASHSHSHVHTHVCTYIQEVQDNSDMFGYKVQETKRGWSSVVNQRVVTNLITPANFCNGEDHSFVVMAINNCGLHGPPSAAAIGKCGK